MLRLLLRRSCRLPTRRLIVVLAAACISGLAWSDASPGSGSQTRLPSIGDPADRYLSPAQETKLGQEILRNAYRSGAVLQDPEISSYVQHLGTRLTNSLQEGGAPYTFFVIADKAINAFAVPGGVIGVNAGLILASNNESELAAVMAHETAHVSQRHIARRIADMSSSSLPTLGAMLAGILLAAGGSGEAGSALIYAGAGAQQQMLLNFTRSNEIEADRIGLDILYRAGFDPNGMSEFFRTLQRQRFSSIPKEFEFLMTHPLDNTRITEARSRIEKLPHQPHESSDYYRFAKARLRALISETPAELVRDLHEELEKAGDKATALQKYAYSQALERRGAFEEAGRILEKLAAAEPENIVYQLGRARAAAKSGNTELALKVLEKMIGIYPDNFAANYYYARTLGEAGRADEGSETLKRFLTSNRAPTPEVHRLLAELYENSGQGVESKKLLAEYYFQTGNYNAAIFQLKEALRSPDVDVISRSQIEKRLREILSVTRS